MFGYSKGALLLVGPIKNAEHYKRKWKTGRLCRVGMSDEDFFAFVSFCGRFGDSDLPQDGKDGRMRVGRDGKIDKI